MIHAKPSVQSFDNIFRNIAAAFLYAAYLDAMSKEQAKGIGTAPRRLCAMAQDEDDDWFDDDDLDNDEDWDDDLSDDELDADFDMEDDESDEEFWDDDEDLESDDLMDEDEE